MQAFPQKQNHSRNRRVNSLQHFDTIVIGTGAAASSAAFKCRKAGWSVAIIDSRPYGGTCELRGCDPKKVLIGAGALIDAFRRMRGRGFKTEEAHIHWSGLVRFRRTFTILVPHGLAHDFQVTAIATSNVV